MARFEIVRGELLGAFEPHDLPGAFILQRYAVVDSMGATPSEQISWSGVGEWIESRDGVPEGHIALWLGSRETTRPHVVFVKQQPTVDSATYEAAYRRAFSARRRPTIKTGQSQPEIDGLQDGWRDRKAAR